MPRITPVRWRVLEKVFLAAGFRFARQEGSHRSYIGPVGPVLVGDRAGPAMAQGEQSSVPMIAWYHKRDRLSQTVWPWYVGISGALAMW